MSDPLATASDVQARYDGTLTSGQFTLANQLCADASVLLRSEMPSIDARVANGTLDPALPLLVVVRMVLRVFRNSRGLIQETEGPFSVTYDRSVAAAELMVTAADLALLGDSSAASVAPAGTIHLKAGLSPRNLHRHEHHGWRRGW